ncbi:MAG TPA: hypothetical protein VL986_10365 [Terracidiphilus sp.]|nr:hypothetical protein [Terracidiphilus sp.]
MAASTEPSPPAPPEASSADSTNGRRNWYVDEIIVALFALFGVGGAVFLPLRFAIPPITTSFLLATGLAALTYRFLGGIQGASFTVGSLKLGGALAALVGIAMLINSTLVKQIPKTHQVWQVSGQVVDDAGTPLPYFDPGDIGIQPSVVHAGIQGKYQITVTSWPDINGNQQFPTVSLSHASFSPEIVDLNPGAQNSVSVTREGQSIVIGKVQLRKLATYAPTQPLTPVAAGLQAPPTATPEQHQ